jgi:pyridoxine 5-phosphate synthase
MTQLSVNVNKIAVLRNSRGGDQPDVAAAAAACLAAGAHGITVHPRPDQRHVRTADVYAIKRLIEGDVEFNIEGNGFAPARGDYPGLLALVGSARPTQVTLVPDGDAQLTSDHGFDLSADAARLRPLIAALKDNGCRVSLFMDADATDIERVAEIGADRVEIYTGPYAQAFAKAISAASSNCAQVPPNGPRRRPRRERGHDLSQKNLGALKSVAVLAGINRSRADR